MKKFPKFNAENVVTALKMFAIREALGKAFEIDMHKHKTFKTFVIPGIPRRLRSRLFSIRNAPFRKTLRYTEFLHNILKIKDKIYTYAPNKDGLEYLFSQIEDELNGVEHTARFVQNQHGIVNDIELARNS